MDDGRAAWLNHHLWLKCNGILALSSSSPVPSGSNGVATFGREGQDHRVARRDPARGGRGVRHTVTRTLSRKGFSPSQAILRFSFRTDSASTSSFRSRSPAFSKFSRRALMTWRSTTYAGRSLEAPAPGQNCQSDGRWCAIGHKAPACDRRKLLPSRPAFLRNFPSAAATAFAIQARWTSMGWAQPPCRTAWTELNKLSE
jgi:hypothetical protein